MSFFRVSNIIAERKGGVRFSRKRAFSKSVSIIDLVPDLPAATCIWLLVFLGVRKRMWADMKHMKVRVVRVRGAFRRFAATVSGARKATCTTTALCSLTD